MLERSTKLTEGTWLAEIQEVVLHAGATTEPELRATWARWLLAYVDSYSRTTACRAAGVTMVELHRWSRDHQTVWPTLLARADHAVADVVAAEVFRRGVSGVETGVWHGGERVGTERRYSDKALEMLAKRTDPVGWGVQEAGPPLRARDEAAVVRALLSNPEALDAARALADALDASKADASKARTSTIIDIPLPNERSSHELPPR